MASKFAWVSGKRGFLVVIALIAVLVNAKTGGYHPDLGFFDGG